MPHDLRLLGCAGLAAATLLCGCAGDGTRSDAAIPPAAAGPQDEQAAIARAKQAAGAPCTKPASLPADKDAPPPARQVQPVLTDKAATLLKNGCAGIRFHIEPDGSVQDASVVVESPDGFGFGRSSLVALRQMQFDPKLASADWYYIDDVILQHVAEAGGKIHLDRTLASWGSHP